MIRSMTGYGKASAQLSVGVVSVEIRSLNSKFLDLSLRMPRNLQDKEYAIRNLLTAPLERGKITVNIQVEKAIDGKIGLINSDLFRSYHQELNQLAEECGLDKSGLLDAIMRIPEIASGETETEIGWWPELEKLIAQAIQQFNQFRTEEGSKTAEDMLSCVKSIEEDLAAVPNYEKERIDNIRTRIQNGLDMFSEQEKIDMNRFEQELVYYLEKLDVSEEKQRLAQHCAFFRTNLKSGAGGKKLGFIAQEMGREINTLGSKCNHVEIQKLVVNMKNELEKIKEQVLNVL
ncbi:MAG: YicC/YloC family endoribonuclease [Bacteroidia bacterium]